LRFGKKTSRGKAKGVIEPLFEPNGALPFKNPKKCKGISNSITARRGARESTSCAKERGQQNENLG